MVLTKKGGKTMYKSKLNGSIKDNNNPIDMLAICTNCGSGCAYGCLTTCLFDCSSDCTETCGGKCSLSCTRVAGPGPNIEQKIFN
jgi:hypothetical protein